MYYVKETSYDLENHQDATDTGDYTLNISIDPTVNSTGLGVTLANNAIKTVTLRSESAVVDTIGGEIVTSAAAEMGVRVEGGTGDDTIYGAGGADRLEGGDDNDILVGGKGGDRLYGDAGDDQLSGGEGSDQEKTMFSFEEQYKNMI